MGDDEFAPLHPFHGLDGVANEVEHDLLNLHRVDEDGRHGAIEFERGLHPALARSDQRKREGFLGAKSRLDPDQSLAAEK